MLKRERVNIRSRVARKLKWLRNYYGLTQQGMANQLQMHVSTYIKNEKNENPAGIWTIWAVYEKLGVSLDWLLLDQGPVSEEERMGLIGDAFAGKENDEKGKKSDAQEILEAAHRVQVDEMVNLMREVPAVHFAMMSAFHEYKLKNADLIEKEKGKI